MPLEIKELQIKVTVNQPQGSSGQTQTISSQVTDDNEAVINQCIEQVMEIFNNKKER